jgi:hypothetical protein
MRCESRNSIALFHFWLLESWYQNERDLSGMFDNQHAAEDENN